MLPETTSFLGTGLVGGGILVAIIVSVSMFLNKGGKKPNLSKLSKVFQKQKQNEIKSIDKKQTQIAAEIKSKETLAEDTQKKIRNVVDKAATDIDRIISTDMTINDIQDEIDSM